MSQGQKYYSGLNMLKHGYKYKHSGISSERQKTKWMTDSKMAFWLSL
jgi:hypothetical protein